MNCGKINFKDKKILIVGGGIYAYRKACELSMQGASVTCVSDIFLEEFNEIKVLKIQDNYRSINTKEFFLIYAATQDKDINHEIITYTNERNVMSASIHKDNDAVYEDMKYQEYDDLTVALSTNGTYPSFSKTVFDDIRKVYSQKYEERLQYLGYIRDYMINMGLKKKYLLNDLLKASIEELKFYANSIQTGKAIVFVFHGVKKLEMYSEILKFIKKVDTEECGVYFSYIDDIALQEYNYFEEVNRIVSLKDLVATLDLLSIRTVTYQPMLFEKGDNYKKMNDILAGKQVEKLLFDEALMKELIKQYLPVGYNLLVLPRLKDNVLKDTVNSLNIKGLTVMKLGDDIPEIKVEGPLHITGFFMLMGEDIIIDVYGKNGIYVKLIETDFDAEMNKKILISDELFINFMRNKLNEINGIVK